MDAGTHQNKHTLTHAHVYENEREMTKKKIIEAKFYYINAFQTRMETKKNM